MKQLVGRQLKRDHRKTLEDPQTLHELAKVVDHIEGGNHFGGWVPSDNQDAVTEAIGTFRTNYAKYQELDGR